MAESFYFVYLEVPQVLPERDTTYYKTALHTKNKKCYQYSIYFMTPSQLTQSKAKLPATGSNEILISTLILSHLKLLHSLQFFVSSLHIWLSNMGVP